MYTIRYYPWGKRRVLTRYFFLKIAAHRYEAFFTPVNAVGSYVHRAFIPGVPHPLATDHI